MRQVDINTCARLIFGQSQCNQNENAQIFRTTFGMVSGVIVYLTGFRIYINSVRVTLRRLLCLRIISTGLINPVCYL